MSRRGRILVTGGAGFIGCNLADRLAQEGHEVLVFDALSRPGVEANLDWLEKRHPKRILRLIADIRNEDAVATATDGVEAVFHLAAQVAVTTSLVDPVEDFEINIRGTLNLLEALRRRGAITPFVFASTNKVYGDLLDVPMELVGECYAPADPALRARGIGEDRPLDFHTPYGCSKGAADQYVLDYARSFGLPSCVLRMSCIYGRRQMGTEDQGWVAHFLIRALRGEPISIYGDGRQVRDVLNVADAVNAYVAAWKRIEKVRGCAFNLGGGPENAVSLSQLIAEIEMVIGRPVTTVHRDWRQGDQRYFVADASALRRALALPAPLGWRAGVTDLASWLSAHPPSGGGPAKRAELRETAVAPRPPAEPARHETPGHVLMTADTVGGVWTYALDLAGALARRNLRLTLAVLGPGPEPRAAAAALAIPDLKLIETGLPLDWTAKASEDLRAAGAALATLAAQIQPDVVHLNSPALAAEARFPAPVVGLCHSCLASWWEAVRGGPPPLDFAWRTEALRRGLRACDLLVAPSRAFAETTARLYALPLPAIVENGRSALVVPAAPRERLAFTAGRLWDEGKNLGAFDAAAALAGVPFLAAGPLEGPSGAHITLRYARALGTLTPEEVAQRLARSAVFVSLARYEPFGLAVLEAAQAGCALVLSDILTFRELWDGAACFVSADAPAAAAAEVARLLADHDRRAEHAAAARQRAQRYSTEAMALGMVEIYAALHARGARERAA